MSHPVSVHGERDLSMPRGRALFLCLTWLVGGHVSSVNGSEAPQSLDTVPIASRAVLADRLPERRLEFPGDVTALADVVYSVPAGFRPLRLDVYYPAKKSGVRPLVIYVHGGGWREGHTRQAGAFEDWPGVLALIAARGYVVASVEYRLSAEARFPAAIQDVKLAIRWLRAHAAEYGIDPLRAVVWGSSAGGQLAALAGVSCDVAALAPSGPSGSALGRVTDCVQGVIAWYGIFDFTTLAQFESAGPLGRSGDERSPPSAYLGCKLTTCDPRILAAASVASYIDSRDPPVLLIHGLADRVVPIQQSRDLADRLRSRHVAVQLVEIPDVDHSFVGADPRTTQKASRQALAASVGFLERIMSTRENDLFPPQSKGP